MRLPSSQNLMLSCPRLHRGNDKQRPNHQESSTMTIGRGFAGAYLNGEDIGEIAVQAFASRALDSRRILVLIPDGTRTMPMPQLFTVFDQILRPRAKAVDYLVALGTHPLMTDQQLSKLVGRTVVNGKVGETN